jgi:hypothetical protein
MMMKENCRKSREELRFGAEDALCTCGMKRGKGQWSARQKGWWHKRKAVKCGTEDKVRIPVSPRTEKLKMLEDSAMILCFENITYADM